MVSIEYSIGPFVRPYVSPPKHNAGKTPPEGGRRGSQLPVSGLAPFSDNAFASESTSLRAEAP